MIKIITLLFLVISTPIFSAIEKFSDQVTPSYDKILKHRYHCKNGRELNFSWIDSFINGSFTDLLNNVDVDNKTKNTNLSPEEAEDIIPNTLSRDTLKERLAEVDWNRLFGTNQEFIDSKIKSIKGAQIDARLPIDPALYFSPEQKKEIVEVAEGIHQLLSTNDVLIVLGQSPAYLAHVLQHINYDSKYSIVSVPYSGIADFTDAVRANNQSGDLNLVTPARQKFWRELIKERGYSPIDSAQRKIFILDLKYSGRGVGSFIRQLVLWHKEVVDANSEPDLNIISLNKGAKAFTKDQSIHSEKSKNGVQTYTDTGVELWGLFSFLIDEYRVYISDSLKYKFDKPEGEDRLVPSFQARFWVPESKDLLAIYPRPYAKAIAEDLIIYAKKHANHDAE